MTPVARWPPLLLLLTWCLAVDARVSLHDTHAVEVVAKAGSDALGGSSTIVVRADTARSVLLGASRRVASAALSLHLFLMYVCVCVRCS
jgi:hypothetical protein